MEREGPARARRWRRLVVVAVAVLAAVAIGAVAGRAWLAERPIRPGLDGCMDVRSASARIDCMRERAAELADRDGTAEAVGELRMVAGRRVPIECHLAMHVLGERTGRTADAAQLDDRWSDLGLDARSTCDQGWLHGYMSTVYEGVRDDELAATIDRCASVTDRPGECDHAIGHAFVRAQHRRDAADALVRCQRLSLEPDSQGRGPATRIHDCQHGAVMEDALLDRAAGGARIDECRDEEAPLARRNCYEFLAARAVLLGDTWAEAAGRCERLGGEGDDREDCRAGWLAAVPDRATCDAHPVEALRTTCRVRVR